MSGSLGGSGSGMPGLNLFSKGTNAAAKPEVEAPNVPVERVVSSPRRVKGNGRRDTILTGADGLS